MKEFCVCTGIVSFRIKVEDHQNEWDAIAELKRRIDQRRHEKHNPEIGMSLVEALDGVDARGNRREKLNFLVLSGDGQKVLCGEFFGVERQQVTRELAAAFVDKLTEAHWQSLPASGHLDDIVYPPYMSRRTYEYLYSGRPVRSDRLPGVSV